MSPECRIAKWKAAQDDFADMKGAFHNQMVKHAHWLSGLTARRTGERRFVVYERLITRWTAHWRNPPL